jgi:molybdate transport system substrate-binding protein
LGSPVHFAKVLERLGIAEELKAKSRLHDGTSFNAELKARGEIDVAIQQISEIIPVKGVELVGPLSADLQLTTVFATGVGAAAKEEAAASEFIKFLRSPAAAAAIRATGMERGLVGPLRVKLKNSLRANVFRSWPERWGNRPAACG